MIAEKEKNPTLVQIGEKVRKLRKQNPNYINYERFAEANNINKVTLQRIESGQNFKMDSLLKVLDALGVGLTDFFSDIDHVSEIK